MKKIVRKVRTLRDRIMSPVVTRMKLSGAGSRGAAGFYYGFFSSSFKREQSAFLAGYKAYHHALSYPTGSLALLRRNIHRLEKGILMKPRRTPFALSYIGETLDAFCSCSKDGVCLVDREEFSWASDVLEQYFEIHAKEQGLAELQKRFEQARIEGSGAGERVPYLRALEEPPSVSYEDLLELSRRRRSVRWFLEKKVERKLLDKALLIAAQSPSACNRQPFRFHFFDDSEFVSKVAKLPMGTGGYSHQIPVIGVVIGQQRNYFNERDRHVIYIDSSLATMSFLYALETVGLSSCCINWPDVENKERKLQELIGLEADERVIMLLAIGYPDSNGMVAYSSKKGLDELRIFNMEK